MGELKSQGALPVTDICGGPRWRRSETQSPPTHPFRIEKWNAEMSCSCPTITLWVSEQAICVLSRGLCISLSCISVVQVSTEVLFSRVIGDRAGIRALFGGCNQKQPRAMRMQLQRLLLSVLRQRLEASISGPGILTASTDDERAA